METTANIQFIITTPEQLEEAFTLWCKRLSCSLMGDFTTREEFEEFGKDSSAKLISLLRELNGNDTASN
jgi:hypothetical protein